MQYKHMEFNFIAALEGKRVVTRKGSLVTELTFFEVQEGKPCLAGVVNGELITWYKEGRWYALEGSHDLDLCMQAEVRQGWLNLFNLQGEIVAANTVHKTEEEAQKAKGFGWHSTVKIEYERMV